MYGPATQLAEIFSQSVLQQARPAPPSCCVLCPHAHLREMEKRGLLNWNKEPVSVYALSLCHLGHCKLRISDLGQKVVQTTSQRHL